VKFNWPWCTHACLLWYGSSRVSAAIGKNNRNSEWFFIIIWEPLCGTGTNFWKIWKHCIFMKSTKPIGSGFLSSCATDRLWLTKKEWIAKFVLNITGIN
jgi:hypothetical protein